MSIQSEITRLSNAKASLKTAIEGKGVTVSSDAKLDAYPSLVSSIEQGGGGGGISVKFLNLITGETMKQMTVEKDYELKASDFPTAANLVETADHPAFNFSNWSAAVGTVIKRPRVILAYYDKVDKTKNEYYCNVRAGQPINIGVDNGSIIDWGDGSATETFDSKQWASHTYAVAGSYKVTMTGTLYCNLDYSEFACPFIRIYAGESNVKFTSGTPFLQVLEYLYLKDATYSASGSNWFKDSALRVATMAPGGAIRSSAFHGCVGLVGVGLGTAPLDEGYSTPSSIFQNCVSLEDISLPCKLGTSMFEGCSALKNIEFLAEPTSVAQYAFNVCSALESIELPATVTTISDYGFGGCSSLKSITLPQNLTTISTCAFNNCRSLASIELPDSLTSIGNSAFAGCSVLSSIEIPDGVSSLGSGVFSECRLLLEITLHEGLLSIAELAGTSVSELDIPDSVITLGPYALSYLYRLSKLVLPPNLSSIAMNLCYNNRNLTEIDVPASVTVINSGAFGFTSAPSKFARIIRMHGSTPPTLNSADAIPAITGLRIIVPAGSLSDYTTAWSGLAAYIEEATA